MNRSILIFALLLALFCVPLLQIVQATPYWSEDDLNRARQERQGFIEIPRFPITLREIDEYILMDEYTQICDFLVTMQEPDTSSPDYGGMHEGESAYAWSIIQTDNTQESIRVWSTYGELTGDIETYRENVQAAWVYTMNYPAYDEEGSTDYYRVHNCGWALVAESKYRQVYGDDRYLWYADSCAWYIQHHRLSYTGALNPLVEGWAAGTLYDYGIEQSDQGAVDSALVIGADVQAWIETDPDRLWNNEDWAMCGGTALWGVCRSVFTDDPVAGQLWLPQYLPYMDTYAGPGQWNNSWNVWYAHAWHASAAITLDPWATGYAFALVDTLLDADTDNDGGIMATSTDPDTEDQSWVSCYLDFMGLEPFFANQMADDAIAFGFTQPDTSYPIAEGEAYDVEVLVAHFGGLLPFGDVDVQITGDFTASGSTYLDIVDIDTLLMGQWTPSQTGFSNLSMEVSPGGQISENDTLTMTVQVLGWGTIQGEVSDASTGEPIASDLFFYRQGLPPDQPLYNISNSPSNGIYEVDVIEGTYSITIDPEIPYTDREITDITVGVGESVTVDFNLTPAPILLVDDDGGAAYDSFFTAPLTNLDYDFYLWENAQNGSPGIDLEYFQAVIWFTGDETEDALIETESEDLILYLQTGGSLLLTGQYIAEYHGLNPLLSGFLGVYYDSSNVVQFQAQGVEGDPVTGGMTVMFPGAAGAANQDSTSMISATGDGVIAMNYICANQPGAAVRVETDYKSLFLGFGLEGVSGGAQSTTRQEFLAAAIDWFDLSTGITLEFTETTPADYALVSLAPNPFNANVQFNLNLPQRSSVDFQIFNLAGQIIGSRSLGTMKSGPHQVNYPFDKGWASGIYYFAFKVGGKMEVIKGVYLK
ncbi:hypothetical protein CEE37_03180 [candidate division LCP-89 bacterium B3_LCP]|uniref:Secretion system C-terminal sorting domain-containing protein n=1 Tax=candidate division LCP-89 bacterium B3_LCP TaxID=2012998 RepID=A0A532V2Y1_UNCL8|nr:MAG: hypothetical protein CEE37_03180 [candidate division LCP-89 bacterium B3_LCP]